MFVISAAAGAAVTALVVEWTGRARPDFTSPYVTYAAALVLTMLALWLIIRPIDRFHDLGQQGRMDMIKGAFSPDVVAEYFTRFWAGRDHFADKVRSYRAAQSAAASKPTAPARGVAPALETDPLLKAARADLLTAFDEHLKELFGVDRIAGAKWMLAIIAGLVLFYAIAAGMLWAAEAAGHPHDYPLGIKPDLAAIAAIFGAYTWIASDVIYRYRMTDLSSSDIQWYVLRFIVAIPLGLALAQFSGFAADKAATIQSSGAILAFVISMFSLSRIQEILGGLTNRAFAIPAAAAGTNEDVAIALPGVDQRIADRLFNEGVNTISQVAVADPVRLCARTGFSFNLVIELIDRAMLWQFLGSKVLTTRLFGWLGASDLLLFADVQKGLADLRKELEAAQAALADAEKAPPIENDPAAEQARAAKLEEFRAAVSAHQAALDATTGASGEVGSEDFIAAISEKAEIPVAGLKNVVKAISDNAHARFVRDVKAAGPTTGAR